MSNLVLEQQQENQAKEVVTNRFTDIITSSLETEETESNMNAQQTDDNYTEESIDQVDVDTDPTEITPQEPRYLGKIKPHKITLKTHEKEFIHWKLEAEARGTSLEEVLIDICRQIFPW